MCVHHTHSLCQGLTLGHGITHKTSLLSTVTQQRMVLHGDTQSHVQGSRHTHSCSLLHSLLVSHTILHRPSQSVPPTHTPSCKRAPAEPLTVPVTLSCHHPHPAVSCIAHLHGHKVSHSSSHLLVPCMVTQPLEGCHNAVSVSLSHTICVTQSHTASHSSPVWLTYAHTHTVPLSHLFPLGPVTPTSHAPSGCVILILSHPLSHTFARMTHTGPHVSPRCTLCHTISRSYTVSMSPPTPRIVSQAEPASQGPTQSPACDLSHLTGTAAHNLSA